VLGVGNGRYCIHRASNPTHTTTQITKMSKNSQFQSSWAKGTDLTASIYLWVNLPVPVYTIVYSDDPRFKTGDETEPMYYHLGDAEAALTSDGYVKLG